ncbi:Maf family protein [Pinisolibacter aquiterrae]|uniref:Maf family protein n=1 Tax=Pinisolibacter aquiterrae TaxID=2815579 RepID=UPI001C3D824B|nr:Maf family protein [Pinisolibacter aquiterrae]MBV5266160.1 Maf family protein [Pinisolibacter aquiterrae]MCC8236248.1 Maf family protein [Pinisolibacter aquiterrae]
MPKTLVLASRSRSRIALLEGAGLAFATEPSDVDERAVEEPLLAAGASPGALALHLAEAKALDVATRRPGDLVLGCDQTLGLDGERFVKPENRAAARAQLERLRGRAHELHSALALVEDGTVVWRHVSVAAMTMRPFSDAFLDAYCDRAGDAVLASVGCYQLEGIGITLFEAIEGDYFTILGLPLLPLLAELRRRGDLPA